MSRDKRRPVGCLVSSWSPRSQTQTASAGGCWGASWRPGRGREAAAWLRRCDHCYCSWIGG
ncbi:hypothetical protein OIY81_3276, partial [Cryptosporidium canis]